MNCLNWREHFFFVEFGGGKNPLLITFWFHFWINTNLAGSCKIYGIVLLPSYSHFQSLYQNLQLPPKTLQIRPSMLKVEKDPKISDKETINSLEIVCTRYIHLLTLIFAYLSLLFLPAVGVKLSCYIYINLIISIYWIHFLYYIFTSWILKMLSGLKVEQDNWYFIVYMHDVNMSIFIMFANKLPLVLESSYGLVYTIY